MEVKGHIVVSNIIGKRVTCSKCKHSWNTKSSYKYVSCPSCLQKVKVV